MNRTGREERRVRIEKQEKRPGEQIMLPFGVNCFRQKKRNIQFWHVLCSPLRALPSPSSMLCIAFASWSSFAAFASFSFFCSSLFTLPTVRKRTRDRLCSLLFALALFHSLVSYGASMSPDTSIKQLLDKLAHWEPNSHNAHVADIADKPSMPSKLNGSDMQTLRASSSNLFARITLANRVTGGLAMTGAHTYQQPYILAWLCVTLSPESDKKRKTRMQSRERQEETIASSLL